VSATCQKEPPSTTKIEHTSQPGLTRARSPNPADAGHAGAEVRANPARIMEVAFGFWSSKALLTAVELGVFTALSERPMTAEEIRETLSLHPRGIYDFLDALVSMGFLQREGNGTAGRYSNSIDTGLFLDSRRPTYLGGILEMLNARLYGYWNDLGTALMTGKPQNEIKHTGKDMYEKLYSEPARLEQFMSAMNGISKPQFEALAEKYDFSQYQSVCDAGGASGLLSTVLAGRHPHLKCVSFDLPEVEPIAKRCISQAGMSDRVTTAAGNFLTHALPRADVITMATVLHNWDLGKKKHLIRLAYEALPAGGAFIAIENLIDDERRANTFGLLMSLNMLIEFGSAFDFSGADFWSWCREAGFNRCEVLPLTATSAAAIAYK
jgi:hypothetical protein